MFFSEYASIGRSLVRIGSIEVVPIISVHGDHLGIFPKSKMWTPLFQVVLTMELGKTWEPPCLTSPWMRLILPV